MHPSRVRNHDYTIRLSTVRSKKPRDLDCITLKFTIITVCYNSETTIADTLRSVAAQTYDEVEHIVVDGGSTDKTMSLVSDHLRPGGKYISEADNGLYDAMNKGLKIASGQVVGLLNSDDMYARSDVISNVADAMARTSVDAILCDVGFFRDGQPNRIVRRYDSGFFKPERLGWGWMPAHPGMFLTKAAYDLVGPYRVDYKIAADFEFIVRAFGRHGLTFTHLAEIAVLMRVGGVSTSGIRSKLTINEEVLRACRDNGIYSNHLMLLSKYARKLMELKK